MKQEFKKVFFKANECIEDAKFLLDNQRNEAAVNRAYYAMFNAVQALLIDKDIYVKTHSGARSKFHELYLKTNLLPESLGEMYQSAFELRQEADYEFEI